jgi:hypothetical protein
MKILKSPLAFSLILLTIFSSCKKDFTVADVNTDPKKQFQPLDISFGFNDFDILNNGDDILLSGTRGYRILDADHNIKQSYDYATRYTTLGNYNGHNYYQNGAEVNGKHGITFRHILFNWNSTFTFEKLGLQFSELGTYYISSLIGPYNHKGATITFAYDGQVTIVSLNESDIRYPTDTATTLGTKRSFNLPRQNQQVIYKVIDTRNGYFIYDRYLKGGTKGYLVDYNGQLQDSIEAIQSVMYKNDNLFISTIFGKLYRVETQFDHAFYVAKSEIDVYDMAYIPKSNEILISNKEGLSVVDYQFNKKREVPLDGHTLSSYYGFDERNIRVVNNKIYTYKNNSDLLTQNVSWDIHWADIEILDE